LGFTVYNGAAFGSSPDILVGLGAGIADFAVLQNRQWNSLRDLPDHLVFT
jgi:hypothetical protein